LPSPHPDAAADGVIQVFLGGGLSHLDSFDPKPDAAVEIRGAFRAISTALDGVQFGELCPSLAKVADKLAIVRSMSHTEADHDRGTSNMLTGYRPSPAIRYPSLGSVVSHELGMRADLPPYLVLPGLIASELGSGYLSSAHGPFAVGGEPHRSDFRVPDLAPRSKLTEARGARRRKLLDAVDAGFDPSADAVAATATFYEQAWNLLGSPTARDAFLIEKEDAKLRQSYGMTAFGQRLLLARRLVEAGVRYVVVYSTGWDMHRGIGDQMRARMPEVDRGVAALVRDLDERGRLDRTLITLTTEFGRTSRMNPDAGRDHWPRVFSVIAAGGGLRRGVVLGASDPTGSEPDGSVVRPADLAATVFAQLGIDSKKRLMSPGDRPIDIVRDGEVLTELLA
jgi:hypothetical protein